MDLLENTKDKGRIPTPNEVIPSKADRKIRDNIAPWVPAACMQTVAWYVRVPAAEFKFTNKYRMSLGSRY